jgi:hypothetical protein
VSAVLGWAVIAVGLRGILAHRIDTRPAELARFAIGGALIHDLLVAPLFLAAGVGVARLVKGRSRPVVQAATTISVLVLLFSYPLVRGFAHANHNPTSLPKNYGLDLSVILGTIWLVAVVVIVVNRRTATHAQIASTTPKGQAPDKKP